MTIDGEPVMAICDRDRSRTRRWPAFLAGLLLGAGIAVGVVLALLNGGRGFKLFGGGRSVVSADDRPTEEEMLDFLNGKTFTLPTKDVNIKGKSVTIRRANISDVTWSSGSRIGGSENPWTHRYSCLYTDGTASYILDVSVNVRSVGTRRAFVGSTFDGITLVEKVVVPER
jgi:hypothetical protein